MNNKIIFNPMMQACTPFANTVESSRLNMQAKYWNQITPTAEADNPFIVDPEIKKVVNVNDHFKFYAPENLIKLYYGNDVLIVYLAKSKKIVTYYVPEYQDAAGASYKIFYVNPNQKIMEGELLYSYAPIDVENQIPKIGYRVKTAFMPFFGFTTEDSYVISDQFAKRAKIIQHEKFFIPISKGLKYFKQFESENMIPQVGSFIDAKKGIYRCIPFEEARNLAIELSNLSNHEIKLLSKKIGPDKSGIVTNVKVHKIKKTIKLQGENLVNKEFYDELEQMHQSQKEQIRSELEQALNIVNNDNIKNQIINGILDTHIFMKKITVQNISNKYRSVFDDLKIHDIDYIIEVDLVQENETAYGDKFTSMYAGKGTVGLIIPEELTPETETGEKIDIFVNPLSIFGRNNWGVIIESLFGKVIKDIEKDFKANNKQAVFEKTMFLFEKYISKEFPELESSKNEIFDTLNHNWDKIRENVLKNGFFIWSSAFTNFTYKELITEIFEPYQEKFNVNLIKKEKIKLSKELLKWLQEIGLHSGAIEPDEDVWIEVYTGWNYYLKLYHTADSKYNVTNIAGKYTSSGQPVRGRRNQGGGHISWQTLGALFSAGATDIIKELYTVKSDSLKDKIDFMTQMIKDKYYLKDRYESRTKETVNVYLKMFGLSID